MPGSALKNAVGVLPVGVVMGITVVAMVSLKWMPIVYLVLSIVAGFLLVESGLWLGGRLRSEGNTTEVRDE